MLRICARGSSYSTRYDGWWMSNRGLNFGDKGPWKSEVQRLQRRNTGAGRNRVKRITLALLSARPRYVGKYNLTYYATIVVEFIHAAA